jgi:hypothetical protein
LGQFARQGTGYVEDVTHEPAFGVLRHLEAELIGETLFVSVLLIQSCDLMIRYRVGQQMAVFEGALYA